MQPKTGVDELPDVYYLPEFGRASALLEEQGQAHWFEYDCEFGRIYSMSVLRRIPEELGGRGDEYDLITPYGYGGPIIIGLDEKDAGFEIARAEMIKGYSKAFDEYCRDNKIISEFVRFHPQQDNHVGWEEYYAPQFCRNTVFIDLTAQDIAREEFSTNRRRWLKRTISGDMDCIMDFSLDRLDDFLEVYYATMENRNAGDFYRFPRSYFEYIKEHLAGNVCMIFGTYFGTVVAAKLMIMKKPYLHNHLGGTIPEFYPLNLYTRMTYEAAVWGKNVGYNSIHLGGGLTNAADDSLLRFKASFSQRKHLKFYIGKRVFDQERYDELCNGKNGSQSFPCYRGNGNGSSNPIK